MRSLLVLIAMTMVGCGGPVPVYLRTTDSLELPEMDPSDEVVEILDDAFGLWGAEWRLVDEERNAIEISLHRLADSAIMEGGADDIQPRHAEVWSSYDSIALGHELGHVFLQQSNEAHAGDDEVERLMHPLAGKYRGDEITDDEWDRAQLSISWIVGP